MKNILVIVFCLMSLCVSGQYAKKIDYEMHERGLSHGENCNLISAIIMPINPAKDDYKAYCRYVVTDIVKKRGYKIEVCIYDNKKAYALYEAINTGRILNKQDHAFVDKHNIGVYDGDTGGEDWGESYVLTYFINCKGTALGKYRGHETFKP